MKRCAQYYYNAVDENSDATSIGPPVSTLLYRHTPKEIHRKFFYIILRNNKNTMK